MDTERLLQINRELDNYSIEIALDSLSRGHRYISELIGTCRIYLNATARLSKELRDAKNVAQHALRAANTLYKINAKEILALDASVRSLPNIKDREAVIDTRLRSSLEEISELEGKLQDIECVFDSSQLVFKSLRDSMSEIRLQRGLLRDELDTGSGYGDERNPNDHVEGERIDYDEIDRHLAEIQDEIS